MTNPFTGVRKAKPTQRHRPALWEGILGAVVAMNDDREIRHFGYRWDEAREFAGITAERDPRLGRMNEYVRYSETPEWEPRQKQMVLWITK